MYFNGGTMTANFAGLAVPPLRIAVAQNEDGTYNADHTLAQILDAYDNGNAVYCQYGNMVLSLEMISKAFCSFACVLSGNVHTVQIGLASVTVTTAPVVKTVNGTEPDENGNVELGISSGGDVWEELINVTTEEEVSKVETTLDNPGKFKIISVCLDLRNVPTNEGRIVTVDINNPYKWTPNYEYTICQVPRFGESNQTDMKYSGAVLFTPSHVISQGYNQTLKTHLYDVNSKITADTVASTIAVTTQNNDTVFGVGSIIKVYGVRA
jgi:hypothetical protein